MFKIHLSEEDIFQIFINTMFLKTTYQFYDLLILSSDWNPYTEVSVYEHVFNLFPYKLLTTVVRYTAVSLCFNSPKKK